MHDAADWLARYRAFWEQRFERLDELLVTLRAGAAAAAPPNDGGATPPPHPSADQSPDRSR